MVSIQYDQILRASLFDAVPFPCLNLHFSLLPRHRGVNPIAWAILSGDSEAGVSLHHMVPDIDAGHVIDQRRVPIDPGGTARELYDALAAACFELFRDSLPFSRALLDGRGNVSIDDIRSAALPAMRHRCLLNFEGEAEGKTTDEIVQHIVETLPTEVQMATA